MTNSALIAGVSGIVGNNLARRLVAEGWEVAGLARRPGDIPGVRPIVGDLLDPVSLGVALAGMRPSHIFITTWMRQPTEAENIRINAALVRNLLNAVAPSGSVDCVSLVTGLKHYLGPFEAYGKGTLPETPFREEQERLDIDNFYYAQEDEVFAAARRYGFGWTVHRPHTIIGFAVGNAMNMGVTLATYGTICRELRRPFIFPGSEVQWNGLTDVTDARVLARHLQWASTTPAAQDQAFNIVNGDIFRWKWMWARLAAYFDVEPLPPPPGGLPLETQLADAKPLWAEIAARHRLAEANLDVLASPWHTDADLGRPIEVVTDMSKSRRLGFVDFQASEDSFLALFAELRDRRLIP